MSFGKTDVQLFRAQRQHNIIYRIDVGGKWGAELIWNNEFNTIKSQFMYVNTIRPGFSKVASCQWKSPPPWLILAGYSASHFFTDGVS